MAAFVSMGQVVGISRRRYRRSGFGAVAAGLPDPTSKELVDTPTLQRGAAAAGILALNAHRVLVPALWTGAISFSLGLSLMLSAKDQRWQKFGAALTGGGVVAGGVALHQYLVERDAKFVRDGYAKLLIQAGEPVPPESGYDSSVKAEIKK